MTEEPWARVSLRVAVDGIPADGVAAALATPSTSRSADWWAAELVSDSAVPLDDQLAEAARYLVARWPALKELRAAGADISLRVSWTPRSPQDGIALNPDLLAVLGSVGGYVKLDTYLG
jgi:hypothetical protein